MSHWQNELSTKQKRIKWSRRWLRIQQKMRNRLQTTMGWHICMDSSTCQRVWEQRFLLCIMTYHFMNMRTEKTTEQITQNYYFLNLQKAVKNYVRNCETCIQNKSARHQSYEKMQSADASKQSWKWITINFITVTDIKWIWQRCSHYRSIDQVCALDISKRHNGCNTDDMNTSLQTMDRHVKPARENRPNPTQPGLGRVGLA